MTAYDRWLEPREDDATEAWEHFCEKGEGEAWYEAALADGDVPPASGAARISAAGIPAPMPFDEWVETAAGQSAFETWYEEAGRV